MEVLIPIDKLIKLAKIKGYSKLQVFNDLEGIFKLKFCPANNKKGGKPIKFPLKPSKDLLLVARSVIPSSLKLHLRTKVNGEKVETEKIKCLIKRLFDVKLRNQRRGVYRIDSSALSRFFKDFFVYEYSCRVPTNDQILELKNNWNKVWG